MKKGCRSAVITYTAFPSETDRHCTACHSWSDSADIGHHPLTPIRYRIGASKYQTIQAEGKVTWLFRLIEMVFKLDTGAEEGKRLHLSFRIAWLKLYDNQKPKENV